MPPPASPAREGDEDNGDIPPAFHDKEEKNVTFEKNSTYLDYS